MNQDPLLYADDEPGFIIAWRMKYQFETGRLDGEMTYTKALEECERLHQKQPEKTFWPQRVSQSADSHGKFHQPH